MADSFVPLYTGTTLDTVNKLDSETLTVGANTVHRERAQVAGASALEVARVIATTPTGTEMGLVVRVAGGAVGGTSSAFGAAFPALGTAAGYTDGTNMIAARGVVGPIPDFTLSGQVVSVNGMLGNDTSTGATNPFALPVGAYRNPTAPAADGKFGALALDASGNLRVAVMSGGTSGAQFAVDSVAGAADLGTAMIAVRTDTLATLTPADGDYARPRLTSVGALWTSLADMAQVIGSVAHGGADTQPPVKTGGRASTTLRTPVTDGQRTDTYYDDEGAIIARIAAHAHIVTGNAANTDGASTELIAAGAAGVRTYLSAVTITNAHATTFGYVEIKDGTTVKHTIPAPPVGGATVYFDPPLRGTAATAWNFDPSAAITTIIASAVGYQSKS